MMILNRHPFSQFRQEMDELFGSMLADAPQTRSHVPPMNAWEENDKYFIEAELPGYRFEDIDVSVLGDVVAIKGRRALAEPEGAKVLRRERSEGSFTRTWTLPAQVDAENVEASLINGVLLISLPKSAKAQPRTIAVKAS